MSQPNLTELIEKRREDQRKREALRQIMVAAEWSRAMGVSLDECIAAVRCVYGVTDPH